MATPDVESAPLLGNHKSNGFGHSNKKKYLGIVALVALATISMSCMITASRHPDQSKIIDYGDIKKKIIDKIYCIDDALQSPVDFKGHLVKGSKGAVAVEAEECSNVGVQSKAQDIAMYSIDHLF